MAKRFSFFLTCFVCVVLILSGCNSSKKVELNVKVPEAQQLNLLFAADLNENKEPIGENYQFGDGEQFVIFFDSNFPFGQENFLVTIYQFDDNGEEQLYDQAELSIDPEWNTGFVPFTLPAGHYEIEVYFHDGLSASRELLIY